MRETIMKIDESLILIASMIAFNCAKRTRFKRLILVSRGVFGAMVAMNIPGKRVLAEARDYYMSKKVSGACDAEVMDQIQRYQERGAGHRPKLVNNDDLYMSAALAFMLFSADTHKLIMCLFAQELIISGIPGTERGGQVFDILDDVYERTVKETAGEFKAQN